MNRHQANIDEGLRRVRDRLASGKIAHLPGFSIFNGSKCPASGEYFSMRVWCVRNECGTVGCIGGWLTVELHAMGAWPAARDTVEENPPRLLERLFYEKEQYDPTPAECVDAIDRYLAGKEPWRV